MVSIIDHLRILALTAIFFELVTDNSIRKVIDGKKTTLKTQIMGVLVIDQRYFGQPVQIEIVQTKGKGKGMSNVIRIESGDDAGNAESSGHVVGN